MEIKLKKLKEGAVVPSHGSDLSAGYDIYACVDKPVTICRGCTGDFAEITAFDVSEEIIRSVTLEDLLSFLNFVTIERDNSPKARIRKAVSLRV